MSVIKWGAVIAAIVFSPLTTPLCLGECPCLGSCGQKNATYSILSGTQITLNTSQLLIAQNPTLKVQRSSVATNQWNVSSSYVEFRLIDFNSDVQSPDGLNDPASCNVTRRAGESGFINCRPATYRFNSILEFDNTGIPSVWSIQLAHSVRKNGTDPKKDVYVRMSGTTRIQLPPKEEFDQFCSNSTQCKYMVAEEVASGIISRQSAPAGWVGDLDFTNPSLTNASDTTTSQDLVNPHRLNWTAMTNDTVFVS